MFNITGHWQKKKDCIYCCQLLSVAFKGYEMFEKDINKNKNQAWINWKQDQNSNIAIFLLIYVVCALWT